MSQPNQKVDLNVILPRHRDHPGWLRVEINRLPKAEFRVLGRGSATVNGRPTGNAARYPFFPAGDTPTGEYVSPGTIINTATWDRDSYGPWGAVRLRAVGGDAVVAETLGHTGLLIHGGAAGRFDGYRSTLGCLRLTNADMKQLREILMSAGDDPMAQTCTGIEVKVNVREF